MNRTLYWLAIGLIAIAFSVVAAWSIRTGGRSRLWRASCVTMVALLVIGFLDRTLSPMPETPVHTYVLAAVVPTTLATVLLQWLVAQRVPFGGQIFAVAITWICVCIASLFSGYYP